MPPFLNHLGSQYAGRYKCVRCCGLHDPLLLCHICSPLGRGVPDIALQSLYYGVLWKGQITLANTTGFSTNVRLTPLLHIPILGHLINPQCTDRGGHYRAAQWRSSLKWQETARLSELLAVRGRLELGWPQ